MKDYVNSAALQEYTTKLVAKLKTLFPGTPTAAATVAEMTDHNKTYVYVGTESGYTAGDWYYWDGTAWTSGGPFQATSIITDTTLAVAGEAADAKATGDAIAAAKTAVLNAMAPAYSTSATYAVGDYVNYNGGIYRCTTAITTAESWTSGHWTAVVLGADLASQVSDLKTQVDDLEETVFGDTTRNYTEDKNLDNSGELIDAAGVCVSEKIACDTWTGYARFYCNDNTVTSYTICFYDSSDVLLQKFKNPSTTGGTEYRNIDVDQESLANHAYVRFSFKKNTTGKVTNNANPPTDIKWEAAFERSGGLANIADASASDVGKALSPKTVSGGKVTEWDFVPVNDYAELQNKPAIGGVTLSGNKTLEDIGAASAGDVEQLEHDIYGETTVNFTPGKRLNSDGTISDDADKCVSEKVSYTWGDNDYARFYCNDNTTTDYYICYYDSSDVLLNAFKNPSTTGNVEYRNIEVSSQATGTPAYVRFSFKKNTTGKITNNANPPTHEYWAAETEITVGLVDSVADVVEATAKTKTMLGADSISVETASLAANAMLKLDDAPWFVMKNQGVSARVKFSAFTSLAVGKGYMNYRGRWILIDGTYVHIYSTKEDDTYPGDAVQYDYKAHPEYIKQEGEWVENPAYEGPSAHSLTISDFIEVSMYETVDGKIRTNIVTLSGSFSVDIESLYRWNYAPFVLGGQDMADVKIGYSCSDIRSPLWMFGDSYLGIAVNRIGGQLRNFGFTSYLMDGVAGGRAVDTGTPGKSVSGDVTKLLAMGTPQYIVWTLGMNGTISMNTDYIDTLMGLCASKGITLILYKVPSVPNNDKATLNAYIDSTGLRYIDAYAAVGANAQGDWYTGFLSSDNIHPSTIGAKAIAMRYLADVPELMQYGYSTGNVESESDDGDET